jgi:hypothetical protein
MIWTSSRFLAIFMLAVLAFPDGMITSASAAGFSVRSVRTIERTFERHYGRAIEHFERYLGNRDCGLACRANSPIYAPLSEKNSESWRWPR